MPISETARPLHRTPLDVRVSPRNHRVEHIGTDFHEYTLSVNRSLFTIDETDDPVVSEHVQHLRAVAAVVVAAITVTF